jgi:hypothetical protein
LKALQSACPVAVGTRFAVTSRQNQKSRQQRQGEAMVKIRSAECLVLVAMVASAAAVQVREYLAEPAVREHAGFAARSACGAVPDGVQGRVLPARCGTAQGMHNERDSDEPHATSRHETGRHARSQGLWV